MASADLLDVCWDVPYFARQTVMPWQDYWWDNARRRPLGTVYCQYTVSGRIAVRDRSGTRSAGPGSLMLFAHGDATAYGRTAEISGSEPYVCEWVELTGAGLAEHWAALQARHGHLLEVGAASPVRTALNHLIDLAQPRAGAGRWTRSAAVHAFVGDLIAGLERQGDAARRPVDRAIDALLADPSAPHHLERLARRHGCTREHLARAFAARVGCGPAAWLGRARSERALRLVRGTTLPLAEIARQCGFPSVTTLSRWIARITGRPPARLRRGR